MLAVQQPTYGYVQAVGPTTANTVYQLYTVHSSVQLYSEFSTPHRGPDKINASGLSL